MSEQYGQAAVERFECASTMGTSVPGNGGNAHLHLVPSTGSNQSHALPGNGTMRGLTEKMDQAVKLLAELAEDVGQIAPEQKHVFEDARAAIGEFGMLVMHAPEGVSGDVTRIVAPMPGVVLRCEKKAGEPVKKGDIVVILDAMKVENPIQVPVNGKIISIRHREGERVAKGSVLAIVKH